MAEYLIPISWVEELNKKLDKIRRKGVNVTFNILGEENFKMPDHLGGGYIPCQRIEIDGHYIINGWVFVGTIQHAHPENIIRLADYRFEGRIPERYRTAPKECEHCHIVRDRTDTYLVYNEDRHEYKQVGRICLKNYTSGLDAETCAQFSSIMSIIERLENKNLTIPPFDDEFLRDIFGPTPRYLDMKSIRKLAYTFVKTYGYESGGKSAREFNEKLDDKEQPLTPATDEEIQGVTDWLESHAGTSDWGRNVRAVWNKDLYEPRDINLLLSGIGVCIREKQKEDARNALLNNEANTYGGEVGQKVTITVENIVILYWAEPAAYYARNYPVYKIIAQDGKIYVWGDSGWQGLTRDDGENTLLIHKGDNLTGTIKKLVERPNGERQTQLTRCKITFNHLEEPKEEKKEEKREEPQNTEEVDTSNWSDEDWMNFAKTMNDKSNLDDNGNVYKGFFK